MKVVMIDDTDARIRQLIVEYAKYSGTNPQESELTYLEGGNEPTLEEPRKNRKQRRAEDARKRRRKT